MKVRCQNCLTDWDPGHIPEDTEVEVVCPSCDWPQMVYRSSLADVVLDNIAAPDRQWLVRKANKQSYGPFDTETIARWIKDEQIRGSDEVAEPGGTWSTFQDHPRFSPLFAKKAPPRVNSRLDNPFQSGPVSISRRSFTIPARVLEKLRGVFMVGVIAGVGAGAYWLIQSRFLVIPQSWVDVGHEKLTAALATFREKGVAPSPGEQAISELLAELRTTWPEVRDSSTRLRLAGRSLYLRDEVAHFPQARELLEKAVVVDPDDAESLAALAEFYARLTFDPSQAALGERVRRLISRCIELAPSSAEVLRAQAVQLISLQNPMEARTLLETILKANPQDATTLWYHGWSYMREPDTNPARALPFLIKALEINPRLRGAHTLAGQAYLAQLFYGRAIHHFTQRTELAPEQGEVWALLGSAWLQIGDGAQALAAYKKAVTLSQQRDLNALATAAILSLQFAGDVNEARRLISLALQSETLAAQPAPRQAEIRDWAAQIFRVGGDLARSEEQSRLSLALVGRDPVANFNLGLVAVAQQRAEEGAQLLARAAAEAGREHQSRIRLAQGRLALAMGRSREAVASLTDALELDPHNFDAGFELAALRLELGQAVEVNTLMEAMGRRDPRRVRRRTFQIDPYYQVKVNQQRQQTAFDTLARAQFFEPNVLATVGMYYYHQGQLPLAMALFQRGLQIKPAHQRCAFYLGVLLADRGDPRAAMTYLDIAASQNSEVPMFYVAQGEALVQSEMFTQADTALQSALRRDSREAAVQYAVCLLETARGNRDKARQACLAALEVDPAMVAARQHMFRNDL